MYLAYHGESDDEVFAPIAYGSNRLAICADSAGASETTAAHGGVKHTLRATLLLPDIVGPPHLDGGNNAVHTVFVTGFSSRLAAYERALKMRIAFIKDCRGPREGFDHNV